METEQFRVQIILASFKFILPTSAISRSPIGTSWFACCQTITQVYLSGRFKSHVNHYHWSLFFDLPPNVLQCLFLYESCFIQLIVNSPIFCSTVQHLRISINVYLWMCFRVFQAAYTLSDEEVAGKGMSSNCHVTNHQDCQCFGVLTFAGLNMGSASTSLCHAARSIFRSAVAGKF